MCARHRYLLALTGPGGRPSILARVSAGTDVRLPIIVGGLLGWSGCGVASVVVNLWWGVSVLKTSRHRVVRKAWSVAYQLPVTSVGCMPASSDAASCQRRTTRSPGTSLRSIRRIARRRSHPAQRRAYSRSMPAICPGRPCNGVVSPADSWQRPSTRLDSMPCTLIREPATSRWMPPCCIAR